MDKNLDLEYKLIPYNEGKIEEYDLGEIIFDLDSELDLLVNKADKLDYLLAIASGLTCGLLDILWVGDFNLARGRSLASDKVDDFVKKTSELISGKKFNNLSDAVRVLEKKFPIPSDRNTYDFGGGLQHHLRDFAHHPTLVGLAFSILTQFTGKSYGTDINGNFAIFDVPENGKIFIGGGARLGLGIGAGLGKTISVLENSSRNSLINEAKLLTSFKEIFLNAERDLEFCEEVLEAYTQNIFDLEKYLIKLKLDMDTLKGKDKKENQALTKNAKEMLKIMKTSRKSMIKIVDEFKKEFDY